MEDIIKREYDRTLREFIERLRVIERSARACSEEVGYRDGIAMCLQANTVETMCGTLQKLLDGGGMPPLNRIIV